MSANAGDRSAIDAVVARLAARQDGVLTTAQAHAAGLTRNAIKHRVDHGWLTPLHHGVYLVGTALAPHTRERAALLASGAGAALGHSTACALHGCMEAAHELHVLVPTGRKPRGVIAHRVESIPKGELTWRYGLAVTTIERTLRDVAGVLPVAELDRVVNEALVQRLVTVSGLLASVERAGPRRGAGRLRELLHDHGGITRSEAERALKRLIARSGMPRPRTNTRVAGYEVDCHWPELSLVVEIDSSSFHGTPRAFQADRAKEAALVAAGQRLLRVTRWETARRPEATVARLAVATAGSLP